MGLLRGLRKKNIMKGAINVLESVQQGETLEERMVMQFTKEVMKDDDIAFVVRAFRNKFDIHGFDLFPEPVLKEGSLTIKEWQFVVNEKILFTEEGLDDLITKISTSIMTKDEIVIDETIRRLKVCLAE